MHSLIFPIVLAFTVITMILAQHTGWNWMIVAETYAVTFGFLFAVALVAMLTKRICNKVWPRG